MRLVATSLTAAVATSLTAVVASPALADDTARPAAFVLMDSTGDGSQFTAELGMVVDAELSEKEMIARTNLLGQYVSDQGFGGYAGIDAIMALFDDETQSFGDYEAIGNLQLGAIYQRTLSPTLDIGARVGVIMPTSSDTGFEPLVHMAYTGVARPSDLATAVPDATWLRLGLSPTFHRGAFIARADVGLDVAVRDNHDVPILGHLNLGVGVQSGPITATAELQTVADLGGGDEDVYDDGGLSQRLAHTGGVAVRYHAAHVAPFLALSSPLDDGARGEVLTVTAGLTAAF